MCQTKCPDALVARLTGETSLREQIEVMAATICPQVIMVTNRVMSLSVHNNNNHDHSKQIQLFGPLRTFKFLHLETFEPGRKPWRLYYPIDCSLA